MTDAMTDFLVCCKCCQMRQVLNTLLPTVSCEFCGTSASGSCLILQ